MDSRKAEAKEHRGAAQESASEELEVYHPWCNPFSSLSTRSYHFDVDLRKRDSEAGEVQCEDGACMAIELIRHKTDPLLIIHSGQGWRVQKNDKGEIEWNLFSPSGKTGKKEIELTQVKVIRFFPQDDDLPDKLEIELGDEAFGDSHGTKQRSIFDLEGGLYYDEKILEQGFEKVTSAEFEKMETNATEDSHHTKGKHYGKWVGGTGGCLVVGGMYTAATLTGVAIQTQALVGAALVGVIGGTIAGAVLGGVVGLVIAGSLVMMGSKTVKGFKVTAASRKIYEKLRCLKEFKACESNVLVPTEKDCPRKR